MKIACHPFDLKPKLFKLLKREVEKSHVIGLEDKESAFLQKLFIFCEVVSMCQASLGVTCLGPGIAEIQIKHIYTMLGKPLLKIIRVTDNKAKIIGSRFLASHRLFEGKTADVAHSLHSDKAAIGVLLRHTDGKITLSAADLKAKLAALIFKCRLWIVLKHGGIAY